MNKKINILDDIGYVELIKHDGDDRTAAMAARVSYNGEEVDRDAEQDYKLIKYLLKHKHYSCFEHSNITFRIKAPKPICVQHMRHRSHQFNEISGRYVELKDEFYVPKEFRLQSTGSNKQCSDDETISEIPFEYDLEEFADGVFYEYACEGYDRTSPPVMQFNRCLSFIVNGYLEHCYSFYRGLIKLGVAKEQARMYLPFGFYTRYYCTLNLRSLFHFLELRLDKHAQYEIRIMAKAMLDLARQAFPETIKIWEELN